MGSGAALDLAGKSDAPLYESVARTLQAEIAKGLYPVGSSLPTEAELRRRFSVSRHTIREALRILRENGLVSSRQGAGTIVRSARHIEEFVLKAESISDLTSYAPDISLDLESMDVERVTGAAAARSGIEGGGNWLVLRGFTTSNSSELPVSWAEHFINVEYASISELLPNHKGPVFRLLEDALGLDIVEIEQDMTGALMPAELAGGLGVDASSAAIIVKRTFRTLNRKVVQITLHTHPAARFRYSTAIYRRRG